MEIETKKQTSNNVICYQEVISSLFHRTASI